MIPDPQPAELALRPPGTVMRLARMGSAFPTRISFMRSLIRRLHAEGAAVARTRWEIDAAGYGHAVYSLDLGGHRYSLVAFSLPLAPEDRTDRVIAEAWDTSYVLFDGEPDDADIARLAGNAPRQEAGRFSERELVLSRANKSVRLFEHVVERLAAGEQPDRDRIDETGYLMRTTAVYGNGKFGIADRELFADRPGLSGPFQAEMLTVWLIRGFTLDLVEHVARARGGEGAATLAPSIRRHLGIGNSTGLGMAPFLVNHPLLLHRWIAAKETALARVRAIERSAPDRIAAFLTGLSQARRHVDSWRVADLRQRERIQVLTRELDEIAGWLTADWLAETLPWDRLIGAGEALSLETQELLVSLILEPHGREIDDLTEQMASGSERRLDPAMTVGRLRALIAADWDWALALDFDDPAETARFWYVSEDKAEPRLGERHAEPGADLELPLDIARRVQALARDLEDADPDAPVAATLLRHPQHRRAVARVQLLARFPYAEIRDNLIGAGCVPVDLLRCKLAFFGAGKFDPKSDRWTRIVLYQGAPGLDEITDCDPDGWAFPTLEPDQGGG